MTELENGQVKKKTMKGQDRKQTIKKKKGLGEPAHEHYKILKKQNNSRN